MPDRGPGSPFVDPAVQKRLDQAFAEGLTSPEGRFCTLLQAQCTGSDFRGRLDDGSWLQIADLRANWTLGKAE